MYRIAGIFRGYKYLWFSLIKRLPQTFIPMNLISHACMHAAERLLFHKNLSNGHSSKVIPLKYTRYTVYIWLGSAVFYVHNAF